MGIIIYQNKFTGKAFNEMLENLYDSKLIYRSSELLQKGLSDPYDLERAVERAIQACRTKGLGISEHFKAIYISRNGSLERDWKLSTLGRKLVVLNISPVNRYIADLQFRLISQLE